MNGIQLLLPVKAYPYAKAIVALLVAVGTSVAATVEAPQWLLLALSILSPIAVYMQVNTPPGEVTPEDAAAALDTEDSL